MAQKLPSHIKQAFIPDHGELTTEEKEQLAECGRKFEETTVKPFRFVFNIADILLDKGETYNC